MEMLICRVRQMEFFFDALTSAYRTDPASLRENAQLADMLRTLTEYYEGGQWRADYEADEQGLLPTDLKRGVLSQDAVYDFLCELPQNEE